MPLLLKRILRVTLTIMLLALPLTVTAQSVHCTGVSAQDTVAGLGTSGEVVCYTVGNDIPVSVITPSGSSFTVYAKTDNKGKGVFTITPRNTAAAGQYELAVGGTHGTFNVLADKFSATKSTVTVSASAVSPGEQVTVTAQLRDGNGNPIADRPLTLLSSNPKAVIDAITDKTGADGNMSWTVTSMVSTTVSVFDLLSSKQIGGSVAISVASASAPVYTGGSPFAAQLTGSPVGGSGFGSVTHFKVETDPVGNIPANQQFTIIFTALDNNEQTVEDYTGTVTITSDAQDGDFPKNGVVTVPAKALGHEILALGSRFSIPGTKTIQIADRDNPAIKGQVTVTVGGVSGGGDGLQIMKPDDGSYTNKTNVDLTVKGSEFVDLTCQGGVSPVQTATDANGIAHASIPLPPVPADSLMRTRIYCTTKAGQQSNAITVIQDGKPPVINAITFSPDLIKAGDQAKITVQVTDDGAIGSVKALIDGTTVVELTKGTATGSYEATFTAPAESKTYTVTVAAEDGAGNKTNMQAQLNVGTKGVPMVSGVTATSQAGGILLNWQPVGTVDPAIAKYKIYIGKDTGNYAWVQEVQPTINAVKISGLESGQTYFFAMTAVNAKGDESGKSTEVSAAPLGLTVQVTPGDGKLDFQWAQPNLPIGHYAVSFGPGADQLSEKKTIDGAATMFTLHDLLNGFTYWVKITPILLNGKEVPELTTLVSGTPSGVGMHAAPSEPVPPYISDTQPPTYVAPPRNASTGLPSYLLWTLAIAALCGGFIVRERMVKKRMTNNFLSMMDQRYRL